MRPPEDVEAVIGAEATTLPVSSPKTVRAHAYALMRLHRKGFAAVAVLNGVAAVAALAGPRSLASSSRACATRTSRRQRSMTWR